MEWSATVLDHGLIDLQVILYNDRMNTAAKDGQGQRSTLSDDSGDMVQSPHDRLLSRALMYTESARELIRSHLPGEFVRHLKLATLEQADTSFVDANLKRRFVDRLFKIELTDDSEWELGIDHRWVHLLVLVDHKSAPDKHTVIQLLGYIVRIWEHSIDNQKPVMPIIPWVIYNGERPWTWHGVWRNTEATISSHLGTDRSPFGDEGARHDKEVRDVRESPTART